MSCGASSRRAAPRPTRADDAPGSRPVAISPHGGALVPVRHRPRCRACGRRHPGLLTSGPGQASVGFMAPARVRGCAVQGFPPVAGSPARQADASRRRNGPRKATCRRPITVRLRGKSCPPGRSDVFRTGRRVVVAQAANPSAGGCGDEDQVGRAGVIPHETVEGGFPRGHHLPWSAYQHSGALP
jgi:hypothetical protein